jgi:hypothetical protein
MPSEGVANDRRAPVRYAPRVAKATRPAALSPTGRNDTQCDWIEKRIDAINARMRQAYSSQEGERFRERLRTLENQRWDAKCRLNQ